MKKVTAFVGSARKKNTHNSVKRFLDLLESYGGIETEIISLYDFHIEICRGCKLCLDRGEELCSLKDDRDTLLAKMAASDGVIFASPNYSFQVSGKMKCFLDRLGFIFHRPRFFGKVYTSIVFQGIYGGDKIVKYLDFVGGGLGFTVEKGICLSATEPISEHDQKKIDTAIKKKSMLFHKKLNQPAFPAPSLLKLMIFRMSRTSMKLLLNDTFCDYNYFMEKGWFESGYYYDIKLNIFQKMAGRVFDSMAAKSAGKKEPAPRLKV